MKTFSALIKLLGIACLATVAGIILSVSSCTTTATTAPTPTVIPTDTPEPTETPTATATLYVMNNTTDFYYLMQTLNGKVVLLELWRIGCPACDEASEQMHPNIYDVYHNQGKGLEVISMHIQWPNITTNSIVNYIYNTTCSAAPPSAPGAPYHLWHFYNYRICFDANDAVWTQYANMYGFNGTPSYVIFDSNGNPNYGRVGYVESDLISHIVPLL